MTVRAGALRLARRAALGGLATLLLGPLLAFGLGHLLFDVPTPDQAVTNQVALVSHTDGTRVTRLVPAEGNARPSPSTGCPGTSATPCSPRRTAASTPTPASTRPASRAPRGTSCAAAPAAVRRSPSSTSRTRWSRRPLAVAQVRGGRARRQDLPGAAEDEILGDHLNAIHSGRGAYGIEAASQAYFGEPVQQLDLSHGALLAGVIQSPSRWDPAVDADPDCSATPCG